MDGPNCLIVLVFVSVQDGRSDHERQYLFCQTVDVSENSELVKTPKWVQQADHLGILYYIIFKEPVAKPIFNFSQNIVTYKHASSI